MITLYRDCLGDAKLPSAVLIGSYEIEETNQSYSNRQIVELRI